MQCKWCGSLESVQYLEKPHLRQDCAQCGKFQKFVKQAASDFVMPIGKYKGTKLSEIDRNYLEWCAMNISKETIKNRIQEYLLESGK